MNKLNVESFDNSVEDTSFGISHFAISVGSQENVAGLTNRIRNGQFQIINEPRITGDGYYESVISDPDGNRVEITI